MVMILKTLTVAALAVLVLALAKSPYVLDAFPRLNKIFFYDETSLKVLKRPEDEKPKITTSSIKLEPIQRQQTAAPITKWSSIGPVRLGTMPEPEHKAPIYNSEPQEIKKEPEKEKASEIAEIKKTIDTPAEKKRIARNVYFRPPAICEKFRDYNWQALVDCTNEVYGIKN